MLECKIKFSKRSIASMISEIERFPDVETGGILLGMEEYGKKYILEAIGPGYKAVHIIGGLTCDMETVNYMVESLKSIYLYKIDVIGIWHKHNNCCNPPFSYVDTQLHKKVQEYSNGNIISALFQKQEDEREYLLSAYQVDQWCKISEEEFEIEDLEDKFLYRYS